MGGELVKFDLGKQQVCHINITATLLYFTAILVLSSKVGCRKNSVRRRRGGSVHFWRGSLCSSPGCCHIYPSYLTLHWLHLFDFSPLCVFKCLLKLLAMSNRWKEEEKRTKAGWWTLSTSHPTTPRPGSSGMPGNYFILSSLRSYFFCRYNLSLVLCQGPVKGGHWLISFQCQGPV